MKLKKSAQQRPNSAHPPGKIRGMEDLKIGMNSVNKSGIQQNTTCMFDYQIVYDSENSKILDDPIEVRQPCKKHWGYMKAELDQRNPYKYCKNFTLNYIVKCEKPLCNLSPYLKATRNISDDEEEKIIELIEVYRDKVKNWDNEEDERFRRFMELQDPEFREKLLACMKEHIQEINLIKSFFVRYKDTHLQKRSKSMTYYGNRDKRVRFKKAKPVIKDKSTDNKENQNLNQTFNPAANQKREFEAENHSDKSAISKSNHSNDKHIPKIN